MEDRTILINLVIIVYMWVCCSFCYYLIGFQLKYLPGDIYSNTYATSLAEAIGLAQSGITYRYTGLKTAMVLPYAVSLMGGICILMYGDQMLGLMPFFVLLLRLGISSVFNIVWLANGVLFPTLFFGSSMGICNVIARIATFFAAKITNNYMI